MGCGESRQSVHRFVNAGFTDNLPVIIVESVGASWEESTQPLQNTVLQRPFSNSSNYPLL